MRRFHVDYVLEPDTPAESFMSAEVEERDPLKAWALASRAIAAHVTRFRLEAVREVVGSLSGLRPTGLETGAPGDQLVVRVHALDGVWRF